MTPTKFDIYVRQGGRWRRLETIEGGEKDAAVRRAAELDQGGEFDGVRAMAVVEYGSGRAPLETLAWISPHLNKMANVQRQMKNAARVAASAEDAPEGLETDAPDPGLVQSFIDEPVEQPDRPAESKPAPTAKEPVEAPDPLRTAAKIAGAVAIAFAITAVLFVPISAGLRGLGNNMGLGTQVIQNSILGATLLVFLISSAFLMTRVYREYKDLMDQAETIEPTPAPPPVPVQPQPRRRTETEDLTLPRRPKSEAPAPSVDEDTSTSEHAPAGQTIPAEPENVSMTEQMRRAVLEFLADSLAAIKDEVPRMNQHVGFGLNLFGAGAAEQYGKHAGLKKFQTFVLVREAVGALGNTAERVDSFCRNFEEYRAQERYRMMINAGRQTMAKKIEGDPNPFDDFADIVKMWTSDSAARAQAQGIVCIMFTDLVGSTQMTHERGDYGAQEIVRIHNAIVRTALATNHGKEVKHTGDGIMASFSTAPNAVRAAMQIRDSLAEHNARDDTLPVRVRMGLNAGEAVQEEDDFFGTTVQLAARVCDKAGEGEVFITDNVRELSKAQGIGFEEAGKYEMKGVPEPMTLFRVTQAIE
ncbi:MAG: adenylate/guanylate cyclase domain-containing protein [Rhodospirillales bacterium]|nr:adenylate/guanylate cyclase domain-containing protein [Rhodospirillales bacterium]MBO6788228.1 adenylate/guanylate cyclase domain-containing protein [Rhodospirillales bacterium]